MTPEQRAECEAFVELQRSATPGPWTPVSRNTCWDSANPDRLDEFLGWQVNPTAIPDRGQFEWGYDAHLCAASRTVPVAELLAENDRLREGWDRLARMYVALGGDEEATSCE